MRIEIKCRSKDTLPMSELVEFQGNLKERTDADATRLIDSIKEYGFSFPFFVWREGDKNNIIDGHGRLGALADLQAEGYEIPPLPVVYINADSADEAKSLLLHVNSLYGETNREELLALIEECGANIDDLSFPEFNIEAFRPSDDGGAFAPTLTPDIDTSEVDDRDIERAGNSVFDHSKNDPMAEFTCEGCGGKIFIKRNVITRYLRGEHV